jgi:hypothetical protein
VRRLEGWLRWDTGFMVRDAQDALLTMRADVEA